MEIKKKLLIYNDHAVLSCFKFLLECYTIVSSNITLSTGLYAQHHYKSLTYRNVYCFMPEKSKIIIILQQLITTTSNVDHNTVFRIFIDCNSSFTNSITKCFSIYKRICKSVCRDRKILLPTVFQLTIKVVMNKYMHAMFV